MLGESNKIVSAAIGCSFNLQGLWSHESCITVIYYLIDYLLKDTLQPQDLLLFVESARERCIQYEGNIPDGENPNDMERPMRRLAQVVQNGITGSVEIGVQQCIMNIYGHSAHSCSERFSYVFATPAIRDFRTRYRLQGNLPIGAHMENAVNRGLPETDYNRLSVSNAQSILQQQRLLLLQSQPPPPPPPPPHAHESKDEQKEQEQPMDPFADMDETIQRRNVSLGTTVRNNDGELRTTSQDIEYNHRGIELAFLSLTEYACIIRRHDKSSTAVPEETTTVNSTRRGGVENQRTRRGRVANQVINFDDTYPLNDRFEQGIASLLTIPMFGGVRSVPAWTKFQRMGSNENLERNKIEEQDLFAEWVLATMIPWPKLNHNYDDVADPPTVRLERILTQLEQGSFLKQENGDYYGPPGYFNAVILADSDDAKAYYFSQKCLSIFIGQLARGLRRADVSHRKAHSMWRGRMSQNWLDLDPESTLFPREYAINQHRTNNRNATEYGDDDHGDNEESNLSTREAMIQFSIDLSRQLAGYTDTDAILGFDTNQQASMDIFLNTIENRYNVMAADPVANANYIPTSTIGPPPVVFPDIDGVNHIDANVIADMSDRIAVDPVAIASPFPQAAANIHTELGVLAVRTLSMNAFTEMIRPSTEFEIIEGRTIPNAEQQNVLRVFAEYFDNVDNGNAAAIPAPKIFLDGAAGTGKSYTFQCLEKLANAISRDIAVTDLTGAACTAIKTRVGARTTQSMFKLGRVTTRLDELTDTKRLTILDNLKNPILVVIDECGFSHAAIFQGVNIRLRQLFNPDLEFGGVAIVMAGDFYQLPPVKASAMYKLAFRFGSMTNIFRNLTDNMEAQGTNLFLSLRRFRLTQQNRIDDEEHKQICLDLRNGNTSGLLAEYVRRHQLMADDRQNFGCPVPIISPGNPERIRLEKDIMKQFARKHGRRVISWRQTVLTKSTSVRDPNGSSRRVGGGLDVYQQILTSTGGRAGVVDLTIQNNPELMAHFCPGAPIIINENIAPLRGIANGTRGVLYSIDWETNDLRERALEFINQQPVDADIELPYELKPSVIFVEPEINRDEIAMNWPPDMTIVPGRIVFPIPFKNKSIILTTGTVKWAVNITKGSYDLGFVSTIHKSQGLTLKKVIISFLKRPNLPSREDFASIYVALTRIRNGSDFRALCDVNDLSWLNDLRPPMELLAFNDGYDEFGSWSYDRANESLVARKAEAEVANALARSILRETVAARGGSVSRGSRVGRRGRGGGRQAPAAGNNVTTHITGQVNSLLQGSNLVNPLQTGIFPVLDNTNTEGGRLVSRGGDRVGIDRGRGGLRRSRGRGRVLGIADSGGLDFGGPGCDLDSRHERSGGRSSIRDDYMLPTTNRNRNLNEKLLHKLQNLSQSDAEHVEEKLGLWTASTKYRANVYAGISSKDPVVLPTLTSNEVINNQMFHDHSLR